MVCKVVWCFILLFVFVYFFNYLDCMSVGFVVFMMNCDFGLIVM